MPTRLWEFAVGGLVALRAPRFGAYASSILGAVGLGCVLTSIVFVDSELSHPGPATLLPVMGAAALLASGGKGAAGMFLSFAPIRAIGLVSYSAYLVHQPLFAFVRIADGGREPTALAAVGLIVLTLCLSALSFYVVERPLRRRQSASWLYSRGALAGLFVASLAGAAFAITPVARPTFTNGQSYDLAALRQPVDRWIASPNGERCIADDIERACIIGDQNQAPSIALPGDSHAAALTGALHEGLARRRLSAFAFTMSGCPFIEGVLRLSYRRACDEHVESVFSTLRERGIDTVIILDRRTGYLAREPARLEDGRQEESDLRLFIVARGREEGAGRYEAMRRLEQETLDRFREAGISVILISSLPEMVVDVTAELALPDAASRLPIGVPRRLVDERAAWVADIMDRNDDWPFYVVNSVDAICRDTEFCAAHSQREVFYSDSNHPSRAGSLLIVEALMPVIDRARRDAALRDQNEQAHCDVEPCIVE